MIIVLLFILAMTFISTYLLAVLCRDVNDIYVIIERYLRSHGS